MMAQMMIRHTDVTSEVLINKKNSIQALRVHKTFKNSTHNGKVVTSFLVNDVILWQKLSVQHL